MQTLAEIRAMLEGRGLSPKKSLGQNFLIDQNLVRKLVEASGVGEQDVVLEVGPGTGTLTEALLARGCRVVAAELDDGLAKLLRERHVGNERFTLVHGDCLADKRTMSPGVMEAVGAAMRAGGKGEFSLVANLPYGAATPVMLNLMTKVPACVGQWVTIQREVADRLMAGPGDEAYGTISVVADAACVRERVAKLPPECFWPRPEVESAMIGLRRRSGVSVDLVKLADFTQRLFAQRRKQLGSVVGGMVGKGVEVRWPAGVSAKDRAENLTTGQIVELMGALVG
jgi:16S rRNA (adenine1518-N6/adenine1519-N6)-dimethyltransferase